MRPHPQKRAVAGSAAVPFAGRVVVAFAGLALVVFSLILVDVVVGGGLTGLDAVVAQAVHDKVVVGWPLHALGELLSLPGSGWVLAPLLAAACALLLAARRGRAALVVVAAPVVSWLMVRGTKIAVGRPLPEAVRAAYPDALAFPSGHVVASMFAAALLVGFVVPWLRGARAGLTRQTLVVSLGVGVACAAGRILVEAHYVTDVVAGAALALGQIALFAWLHDARLARWLAQDFAPSNP